MTTKEYVGTLLFIMKDLQRIADEETTSEEAKRELRGVIDTINRIVTD